MENADYDTLKKPVSVFYFKPLPKATQCEKKKENGAQAIFTSTPIKEIVENETRPHRGRGPCRKTSLHRLVFQQFGFKSIQLWSVLKTKIVRVQYFVRGGFVRHRSRASSKHLSPSSSGRRARFLGGSNRGCLAPENARVGVGSTKKAD
ncbi:hypothetical protein TNCV_2093001 [Trichonephila clavipes]|nr:hypothetical protein TNCV_2093001 [Trichonephila clavipes]